MSFQEHEAQGEVRLAKTNYGGSASESQSYHLDHKKDLLF